MRKGLICINCIVLLLCSQGSKAQKEANIWYFGRFLGLDFNSGTAVPINDGKINTDEGVATICDSNGNLLFYTDGITVWNKIHQVMPNGTGLNGNVSSTQSAVIVPKIGDPNRYYLFTVDQVGGPKGLCYSIVNMLLDNGKGDIEQKNVALQSNVVEKITAVKHGNNQDVWVIAHGVASDMYYSFLVSAAGVSATPVVSQTGAVLPGVVPPSMVDSSSLGYLKVSPDGRRLAAANYTVSVDISDFNNATGVVSNSFNLFLPTEKHLYAYGVEFSPNSNLLYTTVFYTDPINFQKRDALLQYDVSLSSVVAVRASKQTISSTSDPIIVYAALQVAPDGKMYMAKNVYKHIASICNPNIYGPGCGFTSNAIQWSGSSQVSSYGLPTYVQSYFMPVDSIAFATNCASMKVDFTYTPTPNVVSLKWDFDDPPSGANNTSTLNNPSHQFTAPGTYNVELIKFTNCGTDTLRKQVTVDTLIVNLGRDTSICTGTSILLSPGTQNSTSTFLWQDGSANPTLMTTSGGWYWVEVRNILGCVKRDSINISFKQSSFSLGADTSICQNDTLTLTAANNATSYLWNNGAVTPSIRVWQVGTYWCEVVLDGCSTRDSLAIISIKPSPIVNLGNDQTLCEGLTTILDATYLNSTYLWQDGSTNPVYTVSRQGTYSVTVNYNGCKKSDTAVVNYNPKPVFTLGPDQFICPGNPIILKPTLDPSWQLSWQDGSGAPTYTLTQPGNYSLTAANNCGSNTDELTVSKGVCKVYIPTAFTPNNDGLNDYLKVLGTENVIKFDFKIFNRWGEMVFHTADKSKGWDGKLGAVLQSSEVYVYTLEYLDINSTQAQRLKGTFLLIR